MYYTILGISENATITEIKDAYRKLAKKYHPDTNDLESDEMIKLINTAYTELIKLHKHKKDDCTVKSKFHKKIKKKFVSEHNHLLTISFIDSIIGASIDFINYYKHECSNCKGLGSIYSTCKHCDGHGIVNKHDSFISIGINCKQCDGKGYKEITPCIICKGVGYLLLEEPLTINIPEGLEEKTKLLMKGKGNYLNHGRGDLYISVSINSDNHYSRVGNNLLYTCDIDILDILLEKPIEVMTIRGLINIVITPDNYNTPYIVDGFGTKSINGSKYGNMIIQPRYIIKKLTKLQKENLKKYL